MVDTGALPALVATAALGRRSGSCWWSWGSLEQRYDAVKEVLDGEGTVTEVARRYGVTRQA
jgi:hypothetical protein